MTFKISKYTLGLFAAAFALGACTDKVELDLPEGEKYLVVQGWITNDEGPQDISLTYTNAYFNIDAPPPASGATVHVLDNTGELTELEEVFAGVYRFPMPGEIGKSYILEIALPDGSQYRSNPETLFEPVPIDSIYWKLSDDEPSEFNDEEPDDIYDVLIDTNEPAGMGDYYQWRSFLNGKEQREPFDIFATGDEFVDGNPILAFNVTDDLYSAPDTVEIVQEKISRAAYDFLTSLQLQTAFVGGPFDAPPTPIKGNVLNLSNPNKNALGFFGAAGRSRAVVVVGF